MRHQDVLPFAFSTKVDSILSRTFWLEVGSFAILYFISDRISRSTSLRPSRDIWFLASFSWICTSFRLEKRTLQWDELAMTPFNSFNMIFWLSFEHSSIPSTTILVYATSSRSRGTRILSWATPQFTTRYANSFAIRLQISGCCLIIWSTIKARIWRQTLSYSWLLQK